MKYLIIVESPAKAKTISNFLPKTSYKVVATKGHIRDLPNTRFGLTVEDNKIIPKYSVSRENNKKLKDIKEFAKQAEIIYIATDEDREGEAIGYHTAIALKKDPTEIPRIVFHEITETAILKALKNPRKLDMNLINAQQTRRILDRIVGYKLSPLLASKVQRGLSAGRVQSSSLKIIVDREREIKAFIPQEYWRVPTIFRTDLDANLVEFKDEKLEKLTIKDESKATEIYNSILNDVFNISNIENKNRDTSPPPPFMTSTLQQTASNKLGFSPKKTMMLAQRLYEGVQLPNGKKSGLITYMRTDSLNLSEEITLKALDVIEDKYGKEFVKEGVKKYKSKAKGAQEAHEAIRPTLIELTPDEVKESLELDLYKMYKLIYNRFFASQTSKAIFAYKIVTVSGKDSTYKISGRTMIFKGFYIFSDLDEKDRILPDMKVGEKMTLQRVEKEQKFTEPPNKYSEAGLVKKLESLGIGRPSTYAPTISTLQTRGYIKVEKKQINPLEIAFIVMEILEKHFADIVDETFTANMEKDLDVIAEEGGDWQKTLSEFYFPFMKKVEDGKENIISLKVATPLGRECPECKEELLLRKGRFGEFIACSGFPKCRYIENADGTPIIRKEVRLSGDNCLMCNKPMAIKDGNNGEFLACTGFPKCRYTKPMNPTYLENISCPSCEKRIVAFTHTKVPYYRCEDYPKCKFSSKYIPTENTKCSKCGYRVIKRELRGKEIYECLKCKHKEEVNPEPKKTVKRKIVKKAVKKTVKKRVVKK